MCVPGKPHNSLSPSQVRCVAEGGRPAPSFAWKLDDEDYAGEVKDVENGQTLTYTSQPEHNGKTLSCVVNHKGYSEEALAAGSNKASVALDVRFKPVAATQPTNLYGMKIGEPFNVLMSFKSHPAPTEVALSLCKRWNLNFVLCSSTGRCRTDRRCQWGAPLRGSPQPCSRTGPMPATSPPS